MLSLRSAIVAEARSWVGTRFHHQGRLKKNSDSNGGCDCLGLIIEITRKFSLNDKYGNQISSLDQTNYSEIPDGTYLREKLSLHLKEKTKNDLAPGDLALFSFFNNSQHLAIIADTAYGNENHLTIIHAYFSANAVCEHFLDNKWRSRLVSVYSLI